jgi:hypothetical protein
MRLHQYAWENPDEESEEDLRKKHSLVERMKAVDEIRSERAMLKSFQTSNQTNDLRSNLDDPDPSFRNLQDSTSTDRALDDASDIYLSGNEAVDYAAIGVDSLYLNDTSNDTNDIYSNTNPNPMYQDTNSAVNYGSSGCDSCSSNNKYCGQH